MAVFRIEKTRDYTVMSNHHLRNAGLSLKSKGLLSMMLSLPEDWNYTTRGLARICRDGSGQHLCYGPEGAGAMRGTLVRETSSVTANGQARAASSTSILRDSPRPPDTG